MLGAIKQFSTSSDRYEELSRVSWETSSWQGNFIAKQQQQHQRQSPFRQRFPSREKIHTSVLEGVTRCLSYDIDKLLCGRTMPFDERRADVEARI